MKRIGLSASVFQSHAAKIAVCLDKETLAEACREYVEDDRLSENQKDGLEALAIARERILDWQAKARWNA